MKMKLYLAAMALLLASTMVVAQEQVEVLNESLTTEESYNTFTAYSVAGERSWYFDSRYGAVMSGYSGGVTAANDDWFISPEMNLAGLTEATLSFEHTRGSAGVMNVGLDEGWYKVYATNDYTGNPETTAWQEITGVNHTLERAWGFVSSGTLTVPHDDSSTHARIAFRYLCNDSTSATWEIKNVVVAGVQPELPDTLQEIVSLKVATWNVEWLSCTDDGRGPSDTELQMDNVASVIKAMKADVVALQEVGTSSDYATIDLLVERLGSDKWDGRIVPYLAENCAQNQAIVFKKAKVASVNSSLLSSGNGSQGNSYKYNWSSGRYPALYNVNVLTSKGTVPISIVNIHAKAMSTESDYTRRKGGSIGLKTILDGTTYNSKNVILLGDFNDYLEGSQYSGADESPYANFVADADNWQGLTYGVVDPRYGAPVIDNILISNELFDEYEQGSVAVEENATAHIYDYRNTTSGHYPVSAKFVIAADGTGVAAPCVAEVRLFPNPTQSVFYVESELPVAHVEIYDLSGRLLAAPRYTTSGCDISGLANGVYVVRLFVADGQIVVHRIVKS